MELAELFVIGICCLFDVHFLCEAAFGCFGVGNVVDVYFFAEPFVDEHTWS